ncbi:MAG: dephospho-CoA kinase [Chthoniobacteraceae bacterium]
MPVLGITGGIATGKSTLTKAILQRLPAEIFDADQCARALTASNSFVRERIQQAFGAEIYDSGYRLQRDRLREVVFASEERRRELEAILHPIIRAEWMALAEKFRSEQRWLLVDIPLLFETGVQDHFDWIVVVACSPSIQLQRLKEKRSLDEVTAKRMMAAQLDIKEKIAHASQVIWNDAGEAALEAQVDALVRFLLQRFP